MQLSQTLSSAIAQIKVQTAQLQITPKRSCPRALLLFSISVEPKDKFLVDCFNGGGLSGSFLPSAAVAIEGFQGLIYVFPL